jgi:hypothetical protein
LIRPRARILKRKCEIRVGRTKTTKLKQLATGANLGPSVFPEAFYDTSHELGVITFFRLIELYPTLSSVLLNFNRFWFCQSGNPVWNRTSVPFGFENMKTIGPTQGNQKQALQKRLYISDTVNFAVVFSSLGPCETSHTFSNEVQLDKGRHPRIPYYVLSCQSFRALL